MSAKSETSVVDNKEAQELQSDEAISSSKNDDTKSPDQSIKDKSSKASDESKTSTAKDTTPEFQAGTLVLVKIQGFPWWPAVIVTEEHFPAQALSAKPTTKPRKDGSSTTVYPVQFLGSPEYYWSKPSDVKRLTVEDAKSWLDSGRKANSKGLKAAYEEAIGAPSLDKLMSAKTQIEARGTNGAEHNDSDEPEIEDDLDPELDDEGKPLKKNKKKSSRTPKGSATKTPSKRRKSEAADGETSTKKLKSSNKKPAARSNSGVAPESPELSPEESEKRTRANKIKTVMYLRHKLQKTLLGKDEPKASDLEEIPAHLDKLDDIEVDIDIFRETKIGKVLLRIKRLESIPQDESLGIKSHVNKLLAKWQEVMTELGRKSADGNESPAAEDGTPESRDKDAAKSPQVNGTTEVEAKADAHVKEDEAANKADAVPEEQKV